MLFSSEKKKLKSKFVYFITYWGNR